MSWAGGCLWNVGSWLPGFQILMGSVVREVRSPWPGSPHPTSSSDKSPSREGPSPSCSMLTPPCPIYTVTPSHPTPPTAHARPGCSPCVRTQSWVQPGLLRVPRAVTLDRPCAGPSALGVWPLDMLHLAAEAEMQSCAEPFLPACCGLACCGLGVAVRRAGRGRPRWEGDNGSRAGTNQSRTVSPQGRRKLRRPPPPSRAGLHHLTPRCPDGKAKYIHVGS